MVSCFDIASTLLRKSVVKWSVYRRTFDRQHGGAVATRVQWEMNSEARTARSSMQGVLDSSTERQQQQYAGVRCLITSFQSCSTAVGAQLAKYPLKQPEHQLMIAGLIVRLHLRTTPPILPTSFEHGKHTSPATKQAV